MASKLKNGRCAINAKYSGVVVEVVGERPLHTPYLRIGQRDGEFVASLDARQMRHLADAIYESLKVKPSQEGTA